jgi:hypothetical protein
VIALERLLQLALVVFTPEERLLPSPANRVE